MLSSCDTVLSCLRCHGMLEVSNLSSEGSYCHLITLTPTLSPFSPLSLPLCRSLSNPQFLTFSPLLSTPPSAPLSLLPLPLSPSNPLHPLHLFFPSLHPPNRLSSTPGQRWTASACCGVYVAGLVAGRYVWASSASPWQCSMPSAPRTAYPSPMLSSGCGHGPAPSPGHTPSSRSVCLSRVVREHHQQNMSMSEMAYSQFSALLLNPSDILKAIGS